MISTCLEKIIGISNRNCTCLTEIPEEENLSNSGLYVDDIFETTNSLKLKESLNCQDEIWDVFKNARKSSIEEFSMNLLGLLSTNQVKQITDWRGILGDPDRANKLTMNNGLQGFEIVPKSNVPLGLSLQITAVGLLLNGAGIYNLNLHSSESNDPLKSWPITSQINKPTVIEVEEILILPMFTKSGLKISYYFTYDPGTRIPFETKAWCDCNNDPAIAKYLTINGLNDFSTISGISGAKRSYKQMNGIIIGANLSCGNEWLCSKWNYKNDPWALTMAKTIQFMSMVKVLQYVLNSNTINKYTTILETEHLYGKIKHYNKQIEGRMNYLSTEIPEQAKNCWSCTPSSYMGEIIV